MEGKRSGRRTPEVTGDMVSFGAGCSAIFPFTGQAQVVGALPTDVVVAEMVVQGLWVWEGLGAVEPETLLGVRMVGRVEGM
jgi:hypothetical protein